MADRDSEKVWYSDEPKPWYAERERKDQWGDTVIDIRESMGDSFATSSIAMQGRRAALQR